MHIPRKHREEDPQAILEVLRGDGFPLFVTGPAALEIAPLPVVLTGEDPLVIDVHMARGNPQWRSFDGVTEAALVFRGPHDYVSPRWYEAPGEHVPTWNHVTVIVHAVPEVLEGDDHWDVLVRTVDRFEAGRDEPWRIEESQEKAEKLARGTVAFRMRPTRVEAQFKLSQDKPDDVQDRVIAAFDAGNPPLARAMRQAVARRRLAE